MTQHDYSIDNQSFPQFRVDLNNALSSILSLNSGASAPSTAVAGALYYNTSDGWIYQRNAANSAWVKKFKIDLTGYVPQDGSTVYAADAGANDSYAITLDPAPTAYTTGMVLQFKANTINTGAATLNVNSLGAIPIKKSYNTDLADGDIKANQIVSVVYDGTNFQLISPSSASELPPVGHITGCVPASAGGNTVTVSTGRLLADDNATLVVAGSTLTIDISASGANGLDTGSPANGTWYYPWVIYNPGTATVAGLLSTSQTSPTLPSGYTVKRQLQGVAFRRVSGALLPQVIATGWPQRPQIVYNLTTDISGAGGKGATNVVNNGNQTSYTDVALSAFVPPTSRLVVLGINAAFTGPSTMAVRPNGSSVIGFQIGTATASSTNGAVTPPIPTDSSQIVEYYISTASGQADIDVVSYIVTEV